MRIHLSILALAALGSSLAAQGTYQSWTLWSGATDFTSRGSVGTGTGEIHQGVHASTNRGVLDLGGKCVIDRLSGVHQDQNCATQETFSMVVRKGTDAAGPQAGSTGLLGAVVRLTTPTPGARICAFSLTQTLAASAKIVVPANQHWDYGVRFDVPAPNWTMDGHSVHMTRGDRKTATQPWDPSMKAHQKAEDHAWQLVGTSTAATHPSLKRSWRLFVWRQGGVTMNLGCGGRYGMGGSFPAASTASAAQPWTARINGGSAMSGAGSVVAAGTVRVGAIGFGTGANLYILGPYILFFGPAASGSGQAVVPLLPFIPAAAAGTGTFHLQGALGNASGILLANSQSVIP